MRIKRLTAMGVVAVLWADLAYAAVACSVLTEGQDSTNAASYATASVSPGADRLILVATYGARNAAAACTANDVSSITGNGLTYVHINRQCFSTAGAPTQTVELWRSMGASPSTGALTINYGGDSQINAGWAVLECTGIDTSGTNGSGAVAQSAVNLVGPGTSLTVTLGAFGDAGNATLGAFSISDNTDITEGSGFTQLAEQLVSDGGNDGALHVEFKNSNDTSVDASFASNDAAGVAIEIKASAVAANTDGDVIWFH